MGIAQLDTGTIAGTVSDQSGGAIPGAAITIRNVETGVARNLATNAAGRYEAAALPVGNYEVRASLTGFQTLVRSGITLTVGRNAVVDMALQVGEVAQSVTVTGEASFVETTTATVSNLVDERRVSEIPLNNRDLTQLALLQPGVLKMQIDRETADLSVAGGGDKFSVAGARGTHNVYLLDGVSNSDVSGNAQSVAGAYEGAETVQEFQVITNNYSAEYPSKPGAIVSAVTKSGTNSFHGSLYEFLRNDNLDAAKWEDNAFGGEKPEFKRNHLGGSLGGPILRDKTFFFLSYEGLRESRSRTETAIIPTAAGRRGDLGPEGAVFDRTTGSRIWPVDPAVIPYLSLYPLPGEGNALIEDQRNGTAQVAGPRRKPVNDDFGTVKIDHQFGSPRKGFLAATYSANSATVGNYPLLETVWAQGVESRKHVISARHTSILSATALNEFGFGFTHAKTPTDIPLNNIDWKNFNGVDLRFRKDDKTDFMGWLEPGSEIPTVGLGGNEQFKSQDVFTFKDGMSLTRPNHTIKFGTEIQHYRISSIDESDSRNGSYEFAAFELFLQKKPTIFDAVQPAGAVLLGLPVLADALYELRVTQFGFYFQDNWKVRPSLTLNLGLRYEFQTTLSEARDHLSSFQSFFGNQPTVNGVYFTNPTKKNFSPRFGFAWSPGADRKTSLRGGFGIYFVPPNVPEYQFALSTMLPFNAEGGLLDSNSTGAINFPDAYSTQASQLSTAPNYRIVEYEPNPTYAYRWSLTLDREIGNWLFSAGYTGARALHLSVVSEGNMNRWNGWPDNVPTAEKRFPTVAAQQIAINPRMSRLTVNHNAGNSYYQGLAVNIMRRLTAGLQFQVAYTYSKNIDNGSTPGNNTEGLVQGQGPQ
ncbi:MAG: TonB-dependent receptor domain-containing protein, partial [Terriglobia bacterium]